MPAQESPRNGAIKNLQRHQALKVAEQCSQVLKQRFGARVVIPFGTATNDGPWHDGSALDLAVEGLSAARLVEAGRALERFTPPWLRVDLVALEESSPEVRAHLLDRGPVPENPYTLLAYRLREEVVGLKKISDSLERELGRLTPQMDGLMARGLTNYLDDFYRLCERICREVVVALDGDMPRGARWHQVLLGRMGETGPQGRPPVFGGTLLLALDEYRRFYHRPRPIYDYEQEAARLLVLAQNIPATYARLEAALERFSKWLG